MNCFCLKGKIKTEVVEKRGIEEDIWSARVVSVGGGEVGENVRVKECRSLCP